LQFGGMGLFRLEEPIDAAGGNHYPIVESVRNFSAEMYDIASR
jgi:hypothetical protein